MKTAQNFTILALFFLIGCTQTTIDPQAEVEKLMQTSHEWSRSVAAGDIDHMLSFWAEDAVMISPFEPTLNGREAIRQMVEESFVVPGFSISWTPLSGTVSKSGDMGYLIEENRISWLDEGGDQVVMQNNVLTVWRKDSDGNWKNVVDIMSPKPPVD
jgi:ketosteroid isomerase-like protein